jgi:3-methyladenine DNA glycosylase AlkD
MTAETAVRELDAELRRNGSRRRAVGAKAYLKSPLRFYGVTSPDLVAIVRAFDRRHTPLEREHWIPVARALWRRPVHELRSAAIVLAERHRGELNAGDMPLLESWLRASRTWAYVDWICTRLVAPLVERDPALLATIERWAEDDDFWIRRSALLSLLPAMRRGAGEFALFERLAEPMLDEREFFIRKAIGWVLRDVSHRRPSIVAAFVRRHAVRLSGVTWREAQKYLAPRDRAAVERARN